MSGPIFNAKSPVFHVQNMTTFSCLKTNLDLVLQRVYQCQDRFSTLNQRVFKGLCLLG